MGERVTAYDPHQFQRKEFTKHVNSSHLKESADLHLIFMSNHTEDEKQFEVQELNGSLFVTNVSSNVDVKLGEKLLMFNDNDLRGKHIADYNVLLKQCKVKTLSKCLFVSPTHPPEILDQTTKVSSLNDF